jgi:AcrR family transcriptional regulator
MPSAGTRPSKSEATRAKLLECTVQELLVSGADQFGFTAIARRANLSTGALYSRYENSDELLVDVWSMRAWPVFEKFMSDAVEATVSSSNTDAIERVLDSMERQDPDLVAAVALLVVARRNDTLKEVVLPLVQNLFADALNRCPSAAHVGSYLLGELLVAKAFGTKTEGWREFVPEYFGVASNAVADPLPAAMRESFPNTDPTDIDDFDVKLFGALAEVISISGLERATISRIARRANVNPATIYFRYPSKNALISSCVKHYLAAVVKGYFALDERVASGDSLVENMVHLFRARNSDKWETVRRFRLESLYAAWHNVELQSVYADAYTRIAEHDVQTLSRSNNGDEVPFLNFSSFNRVVLFGHSLLFDYGLVQADDDLIASIESGVFNLLMVHSDAEDDV